MALDWMVVRVLKWEAERPSEVDFERGREVNESKSAEVSWKTSQWTMTHTMRREGGSRLTRSSTDLLRLAISS